jgi:hypothetical protein
MRSGVKERCESLLLASTPNQGTALQMAQSSQDGVESGTDRIKEISILSATSTARSHRAMLDCVRREVPDRA